MSSGPLKLLTLPVAFDSNEWWGSAGQEINGPTATIVIFGLSNTSTHSQQSVKIIQLLKEGKSHLPPHKKNAAEYSQ